MCMFDDAESATVLSSKDRVAKKNHTCGECHRTIDTGEKYHTDVYKFDGQVSRHKTCMHCMVARQWLSYECAGWICGCIQEDIDEHVQSGGCPVALSRLAIGMKSKWRTPRGKLMKIPALPLITNQRIHE